VKRWNSFTRWIQNGALPTESVTAHGIKHELEAIVDRRGWESSGSASSERAA
jgi:hypothetical protein